MSFTERNEKVEQLIEPKSSDSEDNCQTDEEALSEESFSESLHRFGKIPVDNSHAGLNNNKNNLKKQSRRLTVSLRYGKCGRPCRAPVKSRKVSKQKKIGKLSERNKNILEKQTEVPKKGKRCRLGGKAKGKPAEEDGHEKYDSDEDSDTSYFGRISLGHFQKFKDKSGASTSYQWQEDDKSSSKFQDEKKVDANISEEMQLLELQKWGNSEFYPSYNKKTDDLSVKDIKPDNL